MECLPAKNLKFALKIEFWFILKLNKRVIQFEIIIF